VIGETSILKLKILVLRLHRYHQNVATKKGKFMDKMTLRLSFIDLWIK
jgi:hypothetical protein